MSFVDLATLTLHCRHELEDKTRIFNEKCDRTVNDIRILKMKANGFSSELNCDPTELKDRFLSVIKKLDEYIYLITELNLTMAQYAFAETGTENTPVQDSPKAQASLSPFNLIDALSEPQPASWHSCPNRCPPQKPTRVLTSKEQQKLIVFSSSSSVESGSKKKEPQCQITEGLTSLSIEVSEPSPVVVAPSAPMPEYNYKECCIAASQPTLKVDEEYPATIMNIDGSSIWVITEDPVKVTAFISEMTDYYKNNKEVVSPSELADLTYCAYYDEGCYCRAMFLDKPEGEQNTVNLYVVDTGEVRTIPLEYIRPLARRFCDVPPYARLCHLAGLDLRENYSNKLMTKMRDAFMRQYLGTQCKILIDDDSSESLGVFVILPSSNITLNEMLINQGLAMPIEPFHPEGTSQATGRVGIPHSPETYQGPPETSDEEWSDRNLDITQCPEYEDPVVAVTGYHNRDEADICKHYKGGPEKTCFKGPRCTKKHILHHPDGWTLDKVEVMGKCKSLPLPAPGTWLSVTVTDVCHYDRVFVHIHEDGEEEKDFIPEFGVVLPPMTLTALQRDMNSPATILSYKPMTMVPALGEIVAALYPLDNCWYRAKVLEVTRHDQSLEVMYVDYGTRMWVKENQIRQLEPRLACLPLQAVQCVLAGVRAERSATSDRWALAKRALAALVQERRVDAHVIAREYDELIVELFIKESDDTTRGKNVAEVLAERGLVVLDEYSVADDNCSQKFVVP